ncbi:Gti1/Pac2 family-domain-containing protein [Mycena galopus ATCC 62051]|nr:Gti1/Pac2 family-domain-containing protein [Mycena galopus ATCC 62051]
MAPPDRGAPPPWSGWIETTGDALLILEAARRGLIPRVTRRLVDGERGMIASGSVFVFNEDESGIKRWTDGFFWSPSRILGNFLLYRETDKKGAGHKWGRGRGGGGERGWGRGRGRGRGRGGESLSRPRNEVEPSVNRHRERTLVGSLTNSYKFKADGLMKKTFSLTIGGVPQHLISYYKVSDVEAGRLRAPSTLPELASLDISPTLLDRGNFRCPPKLEVGPDGVPRYRGEADEVLAAGLDLGLAVAAAGGRRLGPAPAPTPRASTSATKGRGKGEAKDGRERGGSKEDEEGDGDGDSDADAEGEGDETDEDEYEDEDEQHRDRDDGQGTGRAGGKRKRVGREVGPGFSAERGRSKSKSASKSQSKSASASPLDPAPQPLKIKRDSPQMLFASSSRPLGSISPTLPRASTSKIGAAPTSKPALPTAPLGVTSYALSPLAEAIAHTNALTGVKRHGEAGAGAEGPPVKRARTSPQRAALAPQETGHGHGQGQGQGQHYPAYMAPPRLVPVPVSVSGATAQSPAQFTHPPPPSPSSSSLAAAAAAYSQQFAQGAGRPQQQAAGVSWPAMGGVHAYAPPPPWYSPAVPTVWAPFVEAAGAGAGAGVRQQSQSHSQPQASSSTSTSGRHAHTQPRLSRARYEGEAEDVGGADMGDGPESEEGVDERDEGDDDEGEGEEGGGRRGRRGGDAYEEMDGGDEGEG